MGYGSFFGFNEWTDGTVQDNPNRHDYNVQEWVDKVVHFAQQQGSNTLTNHQMWAMGSDFNYQNARRWYHNLDKLIHYVNQDGRVHMLYSTPATYVQHKYEATKQESIKHSKESMVNDDEEPLKEPAVKWEVRTEDMFPLADAAHHYWTGYKECLKIKDLQRGAQSSIRFVCQLQLQYMDKVREMHECLALW